MVDDDSYQKEPDCDSEPTESEIHKPDERHATTSDQEQPAKHLGWREWYRHPEHVFGGSIAVFTAVLTLTSIAQWCVMQGQLDEMKTAGTQVDTAISAMNRIASSMEENAKQSKTALDYTIEKSKLDQRAWLTVKAAKVRQVIAIGAAPMIAIELHNSGQSPALKTRMHQKVMYMTKLPDGPMPSITKGDRSLGVVGPKSSVVGDFTLTNPLTETWMTLLKSGQWSLVTYGTATYLDIFRVQHQTTFCLILQDISKVDLSPCPKWNQAD